MDFQDPASVEALFSAYGDMVYRLAFLRTGNKADADDILQEVFLRYLRRNPDCQNQEHQRAWLIRATINASKNLLSSAWRRHIAPEDDTLKTEMEEKSEVYYAVLALPIKYRTVVHLYYYEGYRTAEIASLLGAKLSTVKSWLFRAREQLLKQLKGEDFDVLR